MTELSVRVGCELLGILDHVLNTSVRPVSSCVININ